jgi:hypothetical protein
MITRTLFLLALTVGALLGSDLTGSWMGTLNSEQGDVVPGYLILTANGATVTGTAGPDENRQVEIHNGTIEGDQVKFEVRGQGGGLMAFTLTLAGDTLNGAIQRTVGAEKQSGSAKFKRAK